MRQSAPDTESLDALKERIDLFLLELKHPILTEPDKELVDLSVSSYSLSTEYHKLLWHVWNDHTNLVRQITGIQKEISGRMELRYQKFGKGSPGVITIAESRAGTEQLQRRSERTRYAQRLRRVLAQLFPEWKVAEMHCEPDLQHSFSGLYARAVLTKGQQAWSVIGAGERESPQAAEGILTYGLLWLDWLRHRDTSRVFEGLKLFVPVTRSANTLQRVIWLDSSLAKYEVYEIGDEVRRLDPADAGNIKTAFAPAGAAVPLNPSLQSASPTFAETVRQGILALSPGIECRWGPGDSPIFAVRGLPFARVTPRGVVFGVGRAETLVNEDNFGELKRLAEGILRIRRPESGAEPEARLHPYYRLQPEKWMQSVVVRHIGVLGCHAVPEALYEQVPALSGSERGLMDLLAVTSAGRLVVVEFKASEDIQLPLQALDYWMRVRWQQTSGEFERNGYFPEKMLSSEPPLLLLVCPALQFHSTCEIVLRYFSKTVEVVRVGLNEEWRHRVQVVFRLGR